MKLRWLLALLPLGCALVISALAGGGWLANPLLYLEGDLSAVVLAAGLLLSALLALYLLEWEMLRRKRQRELARLREESLTEHRRFLQRLDHELKNPLMAVRAGLADLQMSSPNPQERRQLQSMQDQLQRATQLTADLRKLAQMETLVLQSDSVDVSELLTQAFDLARESPASQERQLTLLLPRVPRPPAPVSGDRDLLLAAVSNLLDNALKFTRPGDAIELRAAEVEGFIQIEVADTGPGIPPEDLPHLGKELFRGHNAAGIPGSGVGLALAQAIVARHGGKMTVQSTLGQGTVVQLRLPAGK